MALLKTQEKDLNREGLIRCRASEICFHSDNVQTEAQRDMNTIADELHRRHPSASGDAPVDCLRFFPVS